MILRVCAHLATIFRLVAGAHTCQGTSQAYTAILLIGPAKIQMGIILLTARDRMSLIGNALNVEKLFIKMAVG